MVVRYPAPEAERDHRGDYFVDVLQLALANTQTSHGPFIVRSSPTKMFQERSIQQLKANKTVDVIWTMSSREREAELLPIRIPLLKGLLGQRLLMIRREDLARFEKIDNLSQLASLLAGQGHGWPDSQILAYNKLPVVEGATYQGLFGMLARRRFDYFPRGVSEIDSELQTYSEFNFVVEPRLLLSYRAPIYFFVNSGNRQLAERIEQGLLLAIDNGDFERLFTSYGYDKFAERLNERRVLKLDNPFLHPKTLAEDSPLWLHFSLN
ncbi:hypothetical protein ACRRS0_05640 [Agarivorans sp. QJM3NY_29]|uniref:hypothetical protein n=1 Tax=unclassified Agarivorans TaxID=2636026 RepID=UPI003D7D75F5